MQGLHVWPFHAENNARTKESRQADIDKAKEPQNNAANVLLSIVKKVPRLLGCETGARQPITRSWRRAMNFTCFEHSLSRLYLVGGGKHPVDIAMRRKASASAGGAIL